MHDKKADALRAAMAAAIASKKFTLQWSEIAESAGVAPSTAYRRKDLAAEWREACQAHHLGSEREADTSPRNLKPAVTKKELQRRVATMAVHLEAMVSLVATKDVQIGSLERQLKGSANIVSLSARNT